MQHSLIADTEQTATFELLPLSRILEGNAIGFDTRSGLL
jgi:hypothetical protein